MKIHLKFLIFITVLLLVGCPKAPSVVTISDGRAIVLAKDRSAKLIWNRDRHTVRIEADTTEDNGFVSQFTFSMQVSDFSASKAEIFSNHKSFYYRTKMTQGKKKVGVYINEEPVGSSQGWPCTHAKDLLTIEVFFEQLQSDGEVQKVRFTADYKVEREHNPFNELRYAIHGCQ